MSIVGWILIIQTIGGGVHVYRDLSGAACVVMAYELEADKKYSDVITSATCYPPSTVDKVSDKS